MKKNCIFVYKFNDLIMNDIEMKGGRKVAINLVKANIFSVAILVLVAVVLMVPFFLIWKEAPISQLTGVPSEWFVFFILLTVGIVVHELIHGITWACFVKHGWKSISFGVIWKYLTPYCHCKEPMPVHAYMWGAMMPCLILGVIPAIVAVVIGHLPLLVYGIIFITAAAGDIWMTWLLTKEKSDSMILDHPSEAGYYVLEKE